MKLFLLMFLLLCYTESLKILVVYHTHVKSLNILGYGLVRLLLKDGHEVTFIATHPMEKQPNKNFRQIDISSNHIFKDYSWNIDFIFEHGVEENDLFEVQEMARENSRLTYENKNITDFLENTNEHFDAVVVDLFESEVHAGLGVLYNCPMIWVYSMNTHWQAVRLISDTGNPAYDPNYLEYNIPPFSFQTRVEELWARIKWSLLKTFVTVPVERQIYEKAFGPLLAKRGRELPDYDEVRYNASMIFINDHNAAIARPNTPQNLKFIGGFHIEDPVKPLPKDLQDILDNAPHGVIYFSMGSFWQSQALPSNVKKGLLDVFRELKQTVIWKYEDDLKNLPKNVHTVRWAPQQSILAHPNCKIFLTHGGQLSSIESVHFGVPIIGIPVLFDQQTNMKKSTAHGYAIEVKLNYDLPKNLKAAINLMLSDDTYEKNAKYLSSIYHDVPTKPGDEFVHWVRHVVRTKGALHLRSPASKVPLYQLLYLDLLALILGVLFTLYFSLKTFSKKLNKNAVKKKKE